MRFPSGLIVTPVLGSASVTTLTFTFEPSIGILARKVDRLGLSIRSFREPLKRAIQRVVIPSIQTNFAKSGRPRWVDLAEETWAQKGQGEKILIASGALRSTMAQIGIWHIDMEKALLNKLPEGVWYGIVHQAGAGGVHQPFFDPVRNSTVNLGTTGAIPARPFVMLQPEDPPKIDLVFTEWLAERVKMAGL